VFNDVSPFALGATDVIVSNESGLREAINNAVGPIIITLNKDIVLTESPLVIPYGADVTLTSNSKLANSLGVEFFSLKGVDCDRTIFVCGGILNLDGVIVVHTAGDIGWGIHVRDGKLVMSGGVITNNTVGVYVIDGVFEMSGGSIIANSKGGVHVTDGGSFSMSGGVIANNDGSGVSVGFGGSFVMLGGVIANNTARAGGGVYVGSGSFVMLGGVIANNTAVYGGGVYVQSVSFFRGDMGYDGGGTVGLVCGTISGNTASMDGGGVCIDVKNVSGLFVDDEVVFMANHARTSHNRDPLYDGVYNSNIGSKVTWSDLFIQGYNNYDIGFADGVIVAGGYIMPRTAFWTAFYVIFILLIMIAICVSIAVLFFYFKKRRRSSERNMHYAVCEISAQNSFLTS
jgi:hypothetical protein